LGKLHFSDCWVFPSIKISMFPIAIQREVNTMQAIQVTTADPDAALNENQAAEFLGVSVRTLQAWRVRGGGPLYVKLGRAVRYQRRALIAFQQERTVASTTEADARLERKR
jgi:predicted DNA-binding transcriptional regulator AlpA